MICDHVNLSNFKRTVGRKMAGAIRITARCLDCERPFVGFLSPLPTEAGMRDLYHGGEPIRTHPIKTKGQVEPPRKNGEEVPITEAESWQKINQQVDEFYAELRDPEVPR